MLPLMNNVCFAWLLVVTNTATADTITISTSLGNITGNVRGDMTAPVYEFLGVAYGIAPVGDLRFRPAQLNTSWSTTYDATEYGPYCIQPFAPTMAYPFSQSEDCLLLNIWTPRISTTPSLLLPVEFWIHGGGFVVGSGAEPVFNGYNFVANSKDIVLVTINYRLGPLGFLQSKQLYDEDANWRSYGGMNGVFDQIQALQWVRKYIADFGGDAGRITVFGESAGALSLCVLLVSSMVANDAFHGAIQQSGSCSGPWSPNPIDVGETLTVEALQAQNMSIEITELRTLPASRFNFSAFSPSVDGLVLQQLPVDMYANLDAETNPFNAQRVMLGFNSMDGIIGFPYDTGPVPNTPQEYHEFISAYVDNATQAALIENEFYPLQQFPAYDGRNSASIAWQSINGDVCVACPTLIQIQHIAAMKNVDSYAYEFRGGGAPYYAPHASDVAFVFDHAQDEAMFDMPWNQNLSAAMQSAWSNFGKYGTPNMTSTESKIEWDAFDSDTQSVMILDDDIRMQKDFVSTFRNGACLFWYEEVGLTPKMQQLCFDKKNVN